MLTSVNGSFEVLEPAWARALLEMKKNDPLAPVLVVAPSARLVERLELVLASTGRTFLSVSFHTLDSLAETILENDSFFKKPILSDSVFYDTLVRQLLREDKPFEGFDDLAVPHGFPVAVRGTLRDLVDAGVDLTNLEEAVREEFVGRSVDVGSLRQLLRTLQLYLQRMDALPVLPRHAVLKAAIEAAPTASYLQRFPEIMAYGFYDMTGLQADFFTAIAKNYPTRLYFPYEHGHPAYAFAARFRDNVLQTFTPHEQVLEELPLKPPVSARLINVSGVRDEAWWVATEIARLHREDGIAYSDMAVVARGKDRLQFPWAENLAERGIPVRHEPPRSFMRWPPLTVLLDAFEGKKTEAVGALPGCRWTPFEMAAWTLTWPERASWKEYVHRVVLFLTESFEAKGSVQRWQAPFVAATRELERFALLSAQTSRMDFLDALRAKWEKLSEPSRKNGVGVSLLHAEAARGLSFQVLFLVGLEEKVFPRLIREDPFLRDDARRALSDTLGYRIAQKMSGLEEERLLFHLLSRAARKHLYFVYQRTDEEGRFVGPSPFLRSYVAETGKEWDEAVESIPRMSVEKLNSVALEDLSSTEAYVRFCATQDEPSALALARAQHRDDAALKRGLQMQEALSHFGAPTVYDGLLPANGAAFLKRGTLSPTALETYGTCPFRFFASRLLELESKEVGEVDDVIAPDVKGTLIHKLCENFYRDLADASRREWPERFPLDIFEKSFSALFDALPASEVRLHPVLWRAVRINLHETLRRFLEWDFAFCRKQGWTPRYFEHDITVALSEPMNKAPWKGRVDRIDVGAHGLRVIDYKSGKPFEGVVVTAAKKGLKLQAPVYLMMIETLMEELSQNREAKQSQFDYLFMSPEPSIKTLSYEQWTLHRQALLEAIAEQTDRLLEGIFLIMPGDYCSSCDMRPLCRRDNTLAVVRAQKGPGEGLWKRREEPA